MVSPPFSLPLVLGARLAVAPGDDVVELAVQDLPLHPREPRVAVPRHPVEVPADPHPPAEQLAPDRVQPPRAEPLPFAAAGPGWTTSAAAMAFDRAMSSTVLTEEKNTRTERNVFIVHESMPL